MTVAEANEITETILARFAMIGQYTNAAVGVAYRNTLMAYDATHARSVVSSMLRSNRQPVTDTEMDRMLMPPMPVGIPRHRGNVTDAARGRSIMRRAWIESWCDRHDKTEDDFQRENKDVVIGWSRTDRIIQERKRAGLPVDESGLTIMPPVRTIGPDSEFTTAKPEDDPFADCPKDPMQQFFDGLDEEAA